MNSFINRKWLTLISLLVLTLVLVWNAPEPSSDNVDVVKPVRLVEPTKVEMSLSVEPEKSNRLIKRHMPADVVDIFNTEQAEFKAPVQRVIPTPQPKVTTKKVRLPFKYIGMLGKKDNTTLFIMSGSALHLVNKGDEVENFKLTKIDLDNQQLEWLYLPLKQTHKMSMEQ